MFRSFNPAALPFEKSLQPEPLRIDEARALILRYPNLSETELARLINLYRGMSARDVALILSDENMATGLDRFSADHRSKIRTPLRQYAALLGYAVIGVMMFAWAVSAAW